MPSPLSTFISLAIWLSLANWWKCCYVQENRGWKNDWGWGGGGCKKGKGLLINFITIKWNNFLLTEDSIWGSKRWRLTCLPLASRVDFSRVQRKDLWTIHLHSFSLLISFHCRYHPLFTPALILIISKPLATKHQYVYSPYCSPYFS